MPNPRVQQIYLFNGQRVTLHGAHPRDANVWIAHVIGSGEQVYVSSDWLNEHNEDGTVSAAGLALAAVSPVPEPAAVIAPATQPARVVVNTDDHEEIEVNDRSPRRTRARRPTCPVCEEAYTGTLGTEHACAAVKLARCRSCHNVEARHLDLPPRPPYLCTTCTGVGRFVCKACNLIQNARGRYGDVCDRCNPLPAQNVWNALGNKAKGDDMTIETKSHRPFAVEIESFLMPLDSVSPRGRLNGGWHEGADGSIRPDPGATESVEFKSPPFKGDGGLHMLYSDVKKLRDMGFRANSSTGLHCHVDMISSSVEDRRAIYKFGTWIQDDIYKLVARSRGVAQYCRKLTTTMERADRYVWLNVKHAYERHRTIEFRLHHGTTQADRIVEWAKVCLRIVETGLKLGRHRQRPEGSLFQLLSFNAYEVEYWTDVARLLHGAEVQFEGGPRS